MRRRVRQQQHPVLERLVESGGDTTRLRYVDVR